MTLQPSWPEYYHQKGRPHTCHCPACILPFPPLLLSSHLFWLGCYCFTLLNCLVPKGALNHTYLTWLICLNYYGKHFPDLKIWGTWYEMWFHARSHLSIWRAMIWPGAMASFVPCLSLHLLKQREQRCFTGCLTNKLTAILCCKGPGCLSTICCKPAVPPEKHVPWQSKNDLQGLSLIPLHGTVFLIQTESKKTERQILQLACHVPSQPTFPAFQQDLWATNENQGNFTLHFNSLCGQTQGCGVAAYWDM